MEDTLKSIGEIILIIVGGLLICFLTFGCQQAIDSNKYNDGVCDCGGHFYYEQAVGHRFSTNYIYACDKCGKRIELCYTPTESDPIENQINSDADSWMTEEHNSEEN